MSDTSINTLIESLGVYLPPKQVSTRDVIKACKKKLMFPLERLTGIKSRHMAGDTEYAIDLAIKAVQNCLDNSKYDVEDVDLLICCNISRYDGPGFEFSFEPSTSVRLKKKFGFKNAVAFDISNACAGMFTGVNLCDAFLKSGQIRRAMVVSGEYITHLTKTAQKEIKGQLDSRIPCLTVGDSGVALILEPSEDAGFHDIDMFTLGKYSGLCVAKPTTQQHGGAIMLTDSKKLHKVAIRNSVIQVIQHLARVSWVRNAFNYLIMHQTARVAINETAGQINKRLGVDLCTKETMINNLEERGNTATTSHFLALHDNILNGRIENGDKVIFAVQASGITIGTAPYTFDDLPERMRQANRDKQKQLDKKHTERVARKADDFPVPVGNRIRIESLGTLPLDAEARAKRDSLAYAAIAGEDCIQGSKYDRNDIGLLMHCGVHRNEFICEPAIAAMVAGELKLNDDESPDEDELSASKTFAFDVFNGSMGFLNACHNGVAMIKSKKYNTVMVVASEIENNLDYKKGGLLGIEESGSAVILDESAGDSGFGQFIFRYFTDYIGSYRSFIGQDNGTNFLSFKRDPQMTDYYLDCIPKVVRELLRREKLNLDDIGVIFPPQITADFIERLSDDLDVPAAKFVDLSSENSKDLFTSSLTYALKHAQENELVQPGDIGLIISVGSGIQVGCATYYF